MTPKVFLIFGSVLCSINQETHGCNINEIPSVDASQIDTGYFLLQYSPFRRCHEEYRNNKQNRWPFPKEILPREPSTLLFIMVLTTMFIVPSPPAAIILLNSFPLPSGTFHSCRLVLSVRTGTTKMRFFGTSR